MLSLAYGGPNPARQQASAPLHRCDTRMARRQQASAKTKAAGRRQQGSGNRTMMKVAMKKAATKKAAMQKVAIKKVATKAPMKKVAIKKEATKKVAIKDVPTKPAVVWQCKVGDAGELHGPCWCDYLPCYQEAIEGWWQALPEGGTPSLLLDGGYHIEWNSEEQQAVQVGMFGKRRLTRRSTLG